jgi:DNA-binding NarL/FixJ family response regulator
MKTTDRYRIGIIDDHQLFLDGLSLLVANIDPQIDVEAHPAAKSMIDALSEGKSYDLIICDLIMRELNGLAFLGALKTLKSPPPVIIMSGISSDPPIQQVRAMGARAFIHKSADPDMLTHVIQTVRQGGTWFPGAPTTPDMPVGSDIWSSLTKRHKEILTLLVDGASNRDIAETLCISENTVKSHLKQMFTNFGVTKRTVLVKRARLLGLI